MLLVQLVQQDGTQVSVWLWHKVLRRSFIRLNLAVGEPVLIVYKGRVKSSVPGQSAYADYEVHVDRQQKGGVDWKDIAVRYGDVEELEGMVLADEQGADDDIPF